MTEHHGWVIPAYGLLVYTLGLVIGRWTAMRPSRMTSEYGARDPDSQSKIHAHRNLEMARDAADWWNIDDKVYVRRVTSWRVSE
jgi:hypothetical protein